ncbi:MAG: ATP-binding protein [Rickettsiales bacterium]
MSQNFRFRTLDEVELLLPRITAYFPKPEAVVYGLREVMVNAIEHGNLGITYDEKTQLIADGTWHSEVIRRLTLPEYQQRYAEASITVSDEEVSVTVSDCGRGFDWKPYVQCETIDSVRPNGRGICTAIRLSFDALEYRGIGNEVRCVVRLKTAA